MYVSALQCTLRMIKKEKEIRCQKLLKMHPCFISLERRLRLLKDNTNKWSLSSACIFKISNIKVSTIKTFILLISFSLYSKYI